MSRILAIDYGLARVGTALSDETATLASPLQVLECRGPKQIARDIIHLARNHEATEIVMGWPLTLSGLPGEHAAAIQELVQHLKDGLHVPVHLWDERFTTSMAEKALVSAGQRGKKRKAKVDCAAAAILLQSYLDRRPPLP